MGEREADEQPLELSADCKAFIEINKACSTEIEEHCDSMFFHGDTMTCLTQWKYESLGDSCKASLPKKAESSDEVDAEKAAWRAARKAARGQAIKDIEKEKARKEKEEKKSKKRRRKGKKDQEL